MMIDCRRQSGGQLQSHKDAAKRSSPTDGIRSDRVGLDGARKEHGTIAREID